MASIKCKVIDINYRLKGVKKQSYINRRNHLNFNEVRSKGFKEMRL